MALPGHCNPAVFGKQKIPPSMMMGNWMGSDFTNDDLVKESTRIKDYHAKLIQGENQSSYHVEFVPHKDTNQGKLQQKSRQR